MTEYFGIHTDRWLADKRPHDTLVLDDGSVWQTIPECRDSTQFWVLFSNMEVRYDPGRLGDYHYALVNTSYGQQAPARFVGTVEHPGAGVAEPWADSAA
jgi:hypothetical protein